MLYSKCAYLFLFLFRFLVFLAVARLPSLFCFCICFCFLFLFHLHSISFFALIASCRPGMWNRVDGGAHHQTRKSLHPHTRNRTTRVLLKLSISNLAQIHPYKLHQQKSQMSPPPPSHILHAQTGRIDLISSTKCSLNMPPGDRSSFCPNT